MQTSTHEIAPRSTRRASSTRCAAPAANRKPIYPEAPETTDPLFWLAYYFRNVAELEAIKRLIYLGHKKQTPEPTWRALYAGQRELEAAIGRAIAYVKDEGLLLFAHNDTTVFTTSKVPA